METKGDVFGASCCTGESEQADREGRTDSNLGYKWVLKNAAVAGRRITR